MRFNERAAGYMVKIKEAAGKVKAKIMQMPPQKRKKLFIGVGLGLLVFLLLIRGIISRIPAPIEKEAEKVVRVRAFKAFSEAGLSMVTMAIPSSITHFTNCFSIRTSFTGYTFQ